MPLVASSLLIILLILILIGIIESILHNRSISKIPIRIHVNGTRGKSSVTRLIAAGLRAGGIRAVAKTTGSSPRFIDEEGNDHIIQRFRPASIGEQIRMIYKFSKTNPEALVIECMAVQPQYQWVSEHKIVQSNYGVITNVRADHLEEMGYSLNHIARSLSNTIPFNKKLFTSETKTLEPIKERALKNNCSVQVCDGNRLDAKYLDGFSFIEHPDNIALALEVCRSIGVSKKESIKGMRATNPDPGALTITKLKTNDSKIEFVNAFAANDPQSTLQTILMIKNNFKDKKIGIFLNTRSDRQLRTKQLLDLVFLDIKPNFLVIRGEHLSDELNLRSKKHKNVSFHLYNNDTEPRKIINKILEMNGYLIIGIGNIVGWGTSFMEELRDFNA